MYLLEQYLLMELLNHVLRQKDCKGVKDGK